MNPTLFFVFIFAALTVYTLAKIVSPFLEDRQEQLRFELLDEEVQQIERLVARKSVLLQSLRDIEFDHETGKLSEEDYRRLKGDHEHRAVQVMRKLDELRGDDAERDDEIDSALEQRLRQRADRQQGTPPEGGDQAGEAVECPDCGKQLEAEARFCSRCGTPLDEEETAEGGLGDEASDEQADAEQEEPDEASDEQADAEQEEPDEATSEPDDRNEPTVSDLRSEATG